jgi:hypothetical protein
MHRWRISVRTAVAVIFGVLAILVAAALPAFAAGCDENNPASPSRSTQITLSTNDSVGETHDELRTFVATASLGKVDYTIVSATPGGVLRSLTATPHVSRLSPLYGEQLKGINITAILNRGDRSVRIVVRLKQVCAEYFRESFLTQ